MIFYECMKGGADINYIEELNTYSNLRYGGFTTAFTEGKTDITYKPFVASTTKDVAPYYTLKTIKKLPTKDKSVSDSLFYFESGSPGNYRERGIWQICQTTVSPDIFGGSNNIYHMQKKSFWNDSYDIGSILFHCIYGTFSKPVYLGESIWKDESKTRIVGPYDETKFLPFNKSEVGKINNYANTSTVTSSSTFDYSNEKMYNDFLNNKQFTTMSWKEYAKKSGWEDYTELISFSSPNTFFDYHGSSPYLVNQNFTIMQTYRIKHRDWIREKAPTHKPGGIKNCICKIYDTYEEMEKDFHNIVPYTSGSTKIDYNIIMAVKNMHNTETPQNLADFETALYTLKNVESWEKEKDASSQTFTNGYILYSVIDKNILTTSPAVSRIPDFQIAKQCYCTINSTDIIKDGFENYYSSVKNDFDIKSVNFYCPRDFKTPVYGLQIGSRSGGTVNESNYTDHNDPDITLSTILLNEKIMRINGDAHVISV